MENAEYHNFQKSKLRRGGLHYLYRWWSPRTRNDFLSPQIKNAVGSRKMRHRRQCPSLMIVLFILLHVFSLTLSSLNSSQTIDEAVQPSCRVLHTPPMRHLFQAYSEPLQPFQSFYVQVRSGFGDINFLRILQVNIRVVSLEICACPEDVDICCRPGVHVISANTPFARTPRVSFWHSA